MKTVVTPGLSGSFNRWMMLLAVSVMPVMSLNAATLEWALTSVNPSLDGMVSFADEWSYANWSPNDQNDGTYFAQARVDWAATSTTSSTTVYPGMTLFDLHSMESAGTWQTADYNVFEYSYLGAKVSAWVFSNSDDSNDPLWLANSGLGPSYTTVDDRGFIVRLDDNSATDYHWLPGDAEPGDALFDWGATYGFFGKGGFNDSTTVYELLGQIAGTNEVYEIALYGPAFYDAIVSAGGGGGGGGGFFPCKFPIVIGRNVGDPVLGDPSSPLVPQMFGGGAVPCPEPGSLVGVACMLASVLTIRTRCQRQANS